VIPVECQVGGDTNTTLQPDSGGHGADASGERRATQLEGHHHQNAVVVSGGSSRFSWVNGHGSRRE
jgi:hypothetical protein